MSLIFELIVHEVNKCTLHTNKYCTIFSHFSPTLWYHGGKNAGMKQQQKKFVWSSSLTLGLFEPPSLVLLVRKTNNTNQERAGLFRRKTKGMFLYIMSLLLWRQIDAKKSQAIIYCFDFIRSNESSVCYYFPRKYFHYRSSSCEKL